jgi:hypothetical protein
MDGPDDRSDLSGGEWSVDHSSLAFAMAMSSGPNPSMAFSNRLPASSFSGFASGNESARQTDHSNHHDEHHEDDEEPENAYGLPNERNEAQNGEQSSLRVPAPRGRTRAIFRPFQPRPSADTTHRFGP